MSLLKVLLAVYKWPLLAGILPRLCLTGVTYAQPFLVNRVTSFLGQSTTSTSKEIAYGLIAAYGVVYVGIAVSFTSNLARGRYDRSSREQYIVYDCDVSSSVLPYGRDGARRLNTLSL